MWSSWLSGIPGPSSVTAISTSAPIARAVTSMDARSGEYSWALVSRFTSIWRIRSASTSTRGRPGSIRSVSVCPAASVCARIVVTASSTRGAASVGFGVSARRPASLRARSSRSLRRRTRWRQLSRMISTVSTCLGVSVSRSSISSSAKPRTEVRGLRSSCEVMRTNSSLSRSSRSRWLASCSSSSAISLKAAPRAAVSDSPPTSTRALRSPAASRPDPSTSSSSGRRIEAIRPLNSSRAPGRPAINPAATSRAVSRVSEEIWSRSSLRRRAWVTTVERAALEFGSCASRTRAAISTWYERAIASSKPCRCWMKRLTPITAIAASTAQPIAKPILSRLASDGLKRLPRREYACAAMGDEATGSGDGSATAPDGIDPNGVEAWFALNVPSASPPLTFERISGGHSNLTYRVSDAGGHRWALRRPPLGRRLGSAHDMAREHKVVSALGPTEVPVAPVVGLCEDETVNGAPFYVMEFVEGPILRGLAEAEAFPAEDERRAIGERVADTLVAIHAIDPDAVGLGDLGRKEDYVARQLHRWQGQWEKSKTRELPAIDSVHDRLAGRIPSQGPATIVHGDYRLDNMILTSAGEAAAVAAWQLFTLGNPLAHAGLLTAYWP